MLSAVQRVSSEARAAELHSSDLQAELRHLQKVSLIKASVIPVCLPAYQQPVAAVKCLSKHVSKLIAADGDWVQYMD